MFSTLTARTISSAVLTYLTVAALTFGTLIAFLLSIPIMSTQASVRVKVVPDTWFQQHQPANPDVNTNVEPTAADCVPYQPGPDDQLYQGFSWWLLATLASLHSSSPADAAPSRKPLPYLGFEPLQMISDGTRTARMGSTADSLNECWPELSVASLSQQPNAGGDNGAPDQLPGNQALLACQPSSLKRRVPRNYRSPGLT